MKIIVAGSRSINDKEMVFKILKRITNRYTDVELVSGCAKGPDNLAIEFAENNDVIVHKFPADWDKYGKRAGYLRNEDMAKFSDVLVAFWDGESKGTKHMISLAIKYRLKVKIIDINGDVIKINKNNF